ncbi:hypothetical protein BLOT_016355 [Blomia tropicalis]|nr:hypothetical protein BLOT_016355 [Blomia tropicalis]
MYPTKMFAFIAVVLMVLVQFSSIQFVEAGDKGDTIILGGGHGCKPHFVLHSGDTIIMGGCGKLIYKGGKKSKGHTIIMGGGDCGKKESHHHHYSSHY